MLRTNARKKFVWCIERQAMVVALWLESSAVIIIVRPLIRDGWIRYRWDSRPARKP
ncbi:MAG: hypothetical protein QM753_05710 [Thermomicrobiales bacterium]